MLHFLRLVEKHLAEQELRNSFVTFVTIFILSQRLYLESNFPKIIIINKIKILNKFYLLIINFLSFTSCLKYAAIAEKKLPDETALNKTYAYSGKVIIVGAGA